MEIYGFSNHMASKEYDIQFNKYVILNVFCKFCSWDHCTCLACMKRGMPLGLEQCRDFSFSDEVGKQLDGIT
ncbi:hypothetical protein CEXT_405301 [Caerostris extrusa]|uniref:Uncharacterized protein n=1 Tax=Caerostris extrusa TaxID=172846 RepID=A0AAV4VID0_CAEEX|nr:hypothetical protein CEXT_405301 [Caerostris extrusa]